MSNLSRGILYLGLRRHFRRSHGIALGIMLAVFALIQGSFLRAQNGPEQYLAFNVGFYFTFILPLLAFIGGGGAWRDELKAESADFFLLRGVPKVPYLTFRYLSHALCAEIDFAVALLVLAGIGAVRHVPNLGAALPVMMLAQVLVVAAFAAFGFLCAALTSRWVIIGLIYGAVVEMGLGNIPLAINQFAMSHQARVLLHTLMLGNWSGPDQPVLVTPGRMWAATGYLLLFAAGCAFLAALRFARQEQLGEKPE